MRTAICLVCWRIASGGGSCWATRPLANSTLSTSPTLSNTKPFCLARTVASFKLKPMSLGTATEMGVEVAVGVEVDVDVGVGVKVLVGVAVGSVGSGGGTWYYHFAGRDKAPHLGEEREAQNTH